MNFLIFPVLNTHNTLWTVNLAQACYPLLSIRFINHFIPSSPPSRKSIFMNIARFCFWIQKGFLVWNGRICFRETLWLHCILFPLWTTEYGQSAFQMKLRFTLRLPKLQTVFLSKLPIHLTSELRSFHLIDFLFHIHKKFITFDLEIENWIHQNLLSVLKLYADEWGPLLVRWGRSSSSLESWITSLTWSRGVNNHSELWLYCERFLVHLKLWR